MIAFWILAPMMVISALGLLFARKAVHCALLLAVVMISLAVLYAVQDAPFLFAVQIIVYTGAILMLFLFVLMLVGVDASDSVVETIRGQRLFADRDRPDLRRRPWSSASPRSRSARSPGSDEANEDGNVPAIAQVLFTKYVFAFEVTSALLITAALGAMVLAHRERLTPKVTQRDAAAQRMRDYADHGKHLGPLPPPGVFARHNAVDTPALLPDGTPSEASISRVLAARGSVNAPGSPPRSTTSPTSVPARRSRGRCGRTPDRRSRRARRRVTAADASGAPMSATPFIVLSAILFTIGAVGVLTRRNAIVVFMCVELMLNASNLALVTFSRVNGNLDGQIAAFFVMVVAAAEVVVGLAIIMTIFRTRRSASVDDASLLKY